MLCAHNKFSQFSVIKVHISDGKLTKNMLKPLVPIRHTFYDLGIRTFE